MLGLFPISKNMRDSRQRGIEEVVPEGFTSSARLRLAQIDAKQVALCLKPQTCSAAKISPSLYHCALSLRDTGLTSSSSVKYTAIYR